MHDGLMIEHAVELLSVCMVHATRSREKQRNDRDKKTKVVERESRT